MSDQTEELKDRVEAKRKRIEAQIHELKADGREETRKQADELQHKLHEVTDAVKDGYDNLTNAAAEKINQWLKD